MKRMLQFFADRSFWKILISAVFLLALMRALFPEKSESSLAQERFEIMVQSLGQIDSIFAIRTVGANIQRLQYGDLKVPIEITAIFPDKFIINLQDKEFIIEDNKGWLKYEKGYYEDLPKKFIQEISANLYRNLIYLAKYKQKLIFLESEKKNIEGKNVIFIKLEFKGKIYQFYVDQKANLPIELQYNNEDSLLIRKKFLEFDHFDGINYPVHTISRNHLGDFISESIVDSVFVNPDISED